MAHGLSFLVLRALQGHPMVEPVAQLGRFVMNTVTGIHLAFAENRRTEFGGWPWGRPDPVHLRKTARFAKHADGSVEQHA